MNTTHSLAFEIAPWDYSDDFARFRVGTITGIWAATDDSYDILGITNSNPGNGHFEDVLQWFYSSCLRDKKALRILEVWNAALKKHLIEKRGFKPSELHHVKKTYKQIKREAA